MTVGTTAVQQLVIKVSPAFRAGYQAFVIALRIGSISPRLLSDIWE